MRRKGGTRSLTAEKTTIAFCQKNVNLLSFPPVVVYYTMQYGSLYPYTAASALPAAHQRADFRLGRGPAQKDKAGKEFYG